MSEVDAASPRARRSATWCAATLVMLVLVSAVAVLALPLPWAPTMLTLRDSVLPDLVCLTAAVATATRARRGPQSWVWWLLTAAVLLLFAGLVSEQLGLPLTGSGALSDPVLAGHRLFYPLTYVAVVGLLWACTSHWCLSFVLDGLGGALLAIAISLTFVVEPLRQAGAPLGGLLSGQASPVVDLVLVVVLVCGSLGIATGFDARLVLSSTGLAAFAAADCAGAVLAGTGAGLPTGVLHLLWTVGIALVGVAATVEEEPPDERAGRLDTESWTFILLPMGIGAIGCSLLSPLLDGRIGAPAQWCVYGALCLAMLRVSLTYRDLWALKETRRLALTDELTGLRNRRALATEGAALFARGDVAPVASLLVLDLDGFKEVNDSLGHGAGDSLLVELARRLERALPKPGCVLARLGGDEFAVLLPGIGTDEAYGVAEHLAQEVAQPTVIDDARVDVRGSFGIAGAPEHGTDLPALMRRADIAMYRAKRAGGGVVVFDPEDLDDAGEARLRRVAELRRGLERGEFVVHYQPKVDLRTGRAEGAEALVRWDHPVEGVLAPDRFLPLVDECGLMPALTSHVLTTAVAQAAAWRGSGLPLSVSVNMPPAAVVDADLPDKVVAALADAGLPPEALVLEITEETLLGDRQRARAVLDRIRESGVKISIDDFGSGYSSLAYLRELPVDELKLDRSFVRSMGEDSRAASIVRAAIDLAHSLSMDIVAEGVEDATVAECLAGYGCDIAQGYHYARPQPAPLLERWLREGEESHPGVAVAAAG